MPAQKRAPIFGVGLFFGVLIGVFATLALSSSDTSETWEEYQERMSRRQPRELPAQRGGGDERNPHDGAAPPHGGGADRGQASIAKVHFMKKFVKALTETPQNAHPNPSYRPLLKPGQSIRCKDCHDSGTIDVERMKQLDPGREATERFRHQPRFMIPLMMKWVERFNQRHRDKAIKPLECTDCHAVDPREKFDVYPPLMKAFVDALRSKPTNKNPAANWRPLLKDPESGSMLCSVCHGDVGTMMEKNLDALVAKGRPARYADDKAFMVGLMEMWVETMNRKGKHLLVKPLVCLDCHDTDPRR